MKESKLASENGSNWADKGVEHVQREARRERVQGLTSRECDHRWMASTSA